MFGSSFCGNAFERLGQMLKGSPTTTKIIKCPKCNTEITVDIGGTSGNLDFVNAPNIHSLSPWAGSEQSKTDFGHKTDLGLKK
jgi:hypothetical protein